MCKCIQSCSQWPKPRCKHLGSEHGEAVASGLCLCVIHVSFHLFFVHHWIVEVTTITQMRPCVVLLSNSSLILWHTQICLICQRMNKWTLNATLMVGILTYVLSVLATKDDLLLRSPSFANQWVLSCGWGLGGALAKNKKERACNYKAEWESIWE